jgi:tight adherence protein C
MISLSALSLSATLLFWLALLCAALPLARVRPLPRPALGQRGLSRAEWLDQGGLAWLEPLVRFVAALCAVVPCPRLRMWHQRGLERAGGPWGLCADECLALASLLAVAFALAATALGFGVAVVATALALGAAAPALWLKDHARLRARDIARRLPATIDLMALCMGAGLDFGAALELVVRDKGGGDDPLGHELRRVLHELAMGRVRQRAVAEFAERVPTAAVQDFAHAVIQAERSGTPLAEVLEIQARVLRMRRSVAAEEAGARAGVLLVLPLLLLLCAVLLLLFGPFLVNGMAW